MITTTQGTKQTHPSIGFHAPLEVADVHRVQSLLVLPCSSSPFTAASNASVQPAHNGNRLAPIEMMTPSIHMVLKSGTPVIPKHSSASANSNGLGAAHGLPASTTGGSLPHLDGKIVPPLWVIPMGYIVCAMWFSTCTLMAPGYLHVCGHTLCPLWAAVLLCHAAVFYVVWRDAVWACFGLLVLAIFPGVVVVFNSWIVSVYLIVFAAFASGHFWQTLHGATFIAVCVCWFALLSVFVLKTFIQEHALVQMGLMGLFALAIAVIASLFGMRKFALQVSVSRGS